ncbi:hypothetical protein sscle_01g003600 [Sclerotinia sclerotiorum 1980 UF-70]|uniref:Chromo domain-containing protein n=1 Tax=Sclerotinia sclerotiorum (strain ATCC 18683 / 1980 / Ss-1) TaxID=665079 RepID=A0A1D9PSF3_SCLS1|nr:hypothetical protein sscle_01g003600 [Sclerotinia sclerotiorum 1980 UF-70]
MSSKKANTKVFSSLEEDEISKLLLESTDDEEQYPSDHEFTVERILAQKSEDGQQLYLIRWAGFPEEESSWEPRRNILGKPILDAWKSRQSRELEGLDTPYDTRKLEALKRRVEDGKLRRRRLRREKRKRQGIVVSPHDSDADAGEEESTVLRQNVGSPTPDGKRNPERQQQVQATKKPEVCLGSCEITQICELTICKIQGPVQNDSDLSSDEPLFVNQQQTAKLDASSSKTAPRPEEESQKQAASKPRAADTLEIAAAKKSTSSRGTPKIRGGGAMRGGSSLYSQNVFISGKAPRKQKASLIEAAADSSKDQRHFKTRHILRKVELAGRTMAEKAPDLAFIPGGLINPSKASSAQKPEALRRTSSAPQNEEENRRVPPATPNHEQQEDSHGPAPHPAEMSWEDVQHIPYEQRTRCFFTTQPQGCYNSHCKYLHVDDPRLPVVSAPDGWFDSQKKICFFYNLDGNCRRGDACRDLHNSNSNIPVRSPPPGWVPPASSGKTMSRKSQAPHSVGGPKMVCYYWYSENNCKKGDECKLAHSNDNDFPVATKPGSIPLKSIPCKYWNQGHCQLDRNCYFKHEQAQYSPVVYTSHVDPDVVDLGISRERGSQRPLHNARTTPVPGDDDAIDVEMNAAPDLPPLERNHQEAEQLPFDNDLMNGEVQSAGAKIKAVTFGPQAQPTNLDFTSLPTDASDWKKAFVSAETLHFEQICTVHDFKSKYGHIQQYTYWQQNISTDSTDQAGCHMVKNIAEYLCLWISGLACVSDNYIILLYPVAVEEWKYLDVAPSLPTDAKLRYLVFGTQSHILSSVESSKINQNSSTDLSYRDMMMKSFHHLDYEKLIMDQKSKDQKVKDQKVKRLIFNFCLIFPASNQSTAELIASWLKSCSIYSKIYNYQKPGCWNHFRKNVNAGAVLIHSSALSLISDTDLVHGMTTEGMNYTFWCIQDSTSKMPFSHITQKPELGQIVTKRLLPLGYAILLTPSFLVAEPVMTLNFLKWYQKKLKSSINGSIRVLCCHELPNFLMELSISKVEEQQELMRNLSGDPSMLAKLSAKGLSHEQCEARLDLYWLLCDMLRKDLPANLSPFDCDPSEEESRSPLLFAPPSIDQNDEKKLVAWFAGWAYAHLDKYRRFYVVGSGKSKKSVNDPVRMIPEKDIFPQNSKAFREGGALAWARRGRVPFPIATNLEPSNINVVQSQEVEAELKEFKFDLTDQWYPEWRRNTGEGQSTNHITEYRWDRVFDSLKIPY